jgi:hypothetical protein
VPTFRQGRGFDEKEKRAGGDPGKPRSLAGTEKASEKMRKSQEGCAEGGWQQLPNAAAREEKAFEVARLHRFEPLRRRNGKGGRVPETESDSRVGYALKVESQERCRNETGPAG